MSDTRRSHKRGAASTPTDHPTANGSNGRRSSRSNGAAGESDSERAASASAAAAVPVYVSAASVLTRLSDDEESPPPPSKRARRSEQEQMHTDAPERRQQGREEKVQHREAEQAEAEAPAAATATVTTATVTVVTMTAAVPEESKAASEESKEASATPISAPPLISMPPTPPPAVSARPTRLATVRQPRLSTGSSAVPAAAAAAASRLCVRDGEKIIAQLNLPERRPPVISMAANATQQAGRYPRRQQEQAAQAVADPEPTGRRRSGRSRETPTYVSDASSGDESRQGAAAAAPASSSRRQAARSGGGRVTERQQQSVSRPSRTQRMRAEAERHAKEMGISVDEYLQLRGIELDESESHGAAASAADSAAAPAVAAAATPDDDDESVGPRRGGRATRSTRRKVVRDDDEESEGFRPDEGEGASEDDSASSQDKADDSDEEHEEEDQHARYPRRRAAAPVKFADEQAQEQIRRSARNHQRRSSTSSEEEHGPKAGVQTGYERLIPKMEDVRLADGRVVSHREYRLMQRGGEHVRVLREGEEPDPEGEAAAASAAAAAQHFDGHHPGDVRRSSRARQQVQHYTVGQTPRDSGDDSPDDHNKARYKNGGAAGGKRRTGRSSSNRGPGRSSRHHRRAMNLGDSSSGGSSSSSSSSSDSDSSGKRRRRGRKDRNAIQPLHLQIQHQMRRMEAEAAALSGKAFGGPGAGLSGAGAGVKKSKDGRLADIDPIEIDSQTDWGSVGGLEGHVNSLKEMVVLPLLYPELFSNFHITPPRGVLFFGPPGTGKTLVARALANTCSATGQKVSFFMRKGADCLSKWVGEAERQLRLLFEQAHAMQPSIIFFDEIDGLAPVRSSRQDQIHASIVSTLLALMDGLDSRGQVIVIGATNRPDSIDPALRRPGRFDRELQFALPNKRARREILRIHTREWNPPLHPAFLQAIADQCAGYCGADLKALCTEATLRAVRRQYPQIYHSSEKLNIDVGQIKLTQGDFLDAMRAIVPASQRSASQAWGRPIPNHLAPLLQDALEHVLGLIRNIFPLGALNKSDQANSSGAGAGAGANATATIMEVDEQEGQEAPDANVAATTDGAEKGNAIAHTTPAGTTVDVPPTSFPLHASAAAVSSLAPATAAVPTASTAAASSPVAPAVSAASLSPLPPRPSLPLPLKPRFLLHGASASLGQSHLAPALLHHFEEYPLFSLDLPSLLGDGLARNAEECCVRIVAEARRNAPCVLYWPHLDLWWSTSSESLRNTVSMLIADLPSSAAIFIVATADCLHADLPEELLALFPLSPTPPTNSSATPSSALSRSFPASSSSSTLSYELQRPSLSQLVSFLQPIVDELKRPIPRMRKVNQLAPIAKVADVTTGSAASKSAAAASSTALTPEQQVLAESSLTPAQLELKLSHETSLLRLLRMSLRNILQRLMSSFRGFVHRLDLNDYPDYADVVPEVVALEDIMSSINEEESFDSVSKFNLKIDLLVNNSKEYSAIHGGKFKAWVNEACHMQDVALSMIAQLDTAMVQQCEEISKRRAIRKARAKAAQHTAAPPTRSNLRSSSKQQPQQETHLIDENSADGSADTSSSVSAAAAPASIPAPASTADTATRMEMDGEDEKAVKTEGVNSVPESAAPPAPASESPSDATAPATAPATAAAAAASVGVLSPSPSLSAAATVTLLPPPPPLQLDASLASRLPADLAAVLLGCTVDEAEQVGFQLIRCVVQHQMLPDRNAAMEQMRQIAQENKPRTAHR